MIVRKKIAVFYVSLPVHHGFINLDKTKLTPIIYVQLHCLTGEKGNLNKSMVLLFAIYLFI